MFEKASRLKLRFNTTKGSVEVKDLWDMPLLSNTHFCLDDIAKDVAASLDVAGSFVLKKSEANTTDELRLDILKHIIKVRLGEEKAAKDAVLAKERKSKILDIISEKEDDSLKELSVKDLKKMVKKI